MIAFFGMKLNAPKSMGCHKWERKCPPQINAAKCRRFSEDNVMASHLVFGAIGEAPKTSSKIYVGELGDVQLPM